MYVINYSNGKVQANVMFHNLAVALVVAARYKMKGLKVTLLRIATSSVKEVF
jgi:hypothetical protein